jgi:hypothetical protein
MKVSPAAFQEIATEPTYRRAFAAQVQLYILGDFSP